MVLEVFFLKGLWVNDPIGWAYFSTRLVQPIYLVNTTSPTLGVIEWYLMFEPFGHVRKTPCRVSHVTLVGVCCRWLVDRHRWKLSQLILETSPDDLSTMRREWQDQYFSGRWHAQEKRIHSGYLHHMFPHCNKYQIWNLIDEKNTPPQTSP